MESVQFLLASYVQHFPIRSRSIIYMENNKPPALCLVYSIARDTDENVLRIHVFLDRDRHFV